MKLTMGNADRFVRKSINVVAALAVGGLAAVAQTFPDPTANDWDCIMSGARKGIAHIAFNPDFTLLINQIKVPSKATSGTDSRSGQDGSGLGDPRSGEAGSGSTDSQLQIFGYGSETGQWGFDAKGRIIGYFAEIIQGDCTTNTVVTSNTVTNTDGSTSISTSTNVVVDCEGVTNAISFVGKVVTGKRLSLVCSTTFGKVSYRGLPLISVTNLDASKWYGMKVDDKLTFQEFFSLTSVVDPNTYNVQGSGPGYTYNNAGICMVSSQRQIAFALALDGDADADHIVRATFGPFNPKKISFKSVGWEQPSGSMTNKITFSGELLPQAILPAQ